MDSRSDAQVVAAVLGGDVEAYAVLVARYRDAYTRFAVRMLGSAYDADEALQTAFLRGFRALSQCKDPSRFGAWLYRIVANQCREIAVRRGRRERRFVSDEQSLQMQSTPHPADVDTGMREEIERALWQLDPQQREAFVLKYVEELSYEEMAEITGAGVSALKMRVKRACERLRNLLEEVQHA